jgi:regulator of protease activity HflC (stomatin/prohibitin superfamily)
VGMTLLVLMVMLLVGMIALANSVMIVREDERLVVLRLGRLLRVAGPGLVLLLPSIDRGIRVSLTRKVPGWQGMTPEQIEARVKDAAFDP